MVSSMSGHCNGANMMINPHLVGLTHHFPWFPWGVSEFLHGMARPMHRSGTGPAPLGEGQGRDSETLLGLEARISSTGQVGWDVFVDFFPTKHVDEMGLKC